MAFLWYASECGERDAPLLKMTESTMDRYAVAELEP